VTPRTWTWKQVLVELSLALLLGAGVALCVLLAALAGVPGVE
jgi:hypothetical protein